jgi:hypothetical protein
MLVKSLKWGAQVVMAAGVLLCGNGYAQSTLLDEVHTVANADRAAPVEHSFDITVAGTYQITLVDLGATQTPAAPLTSVKLALTSGNTLVGAPLPLLAAGSAQFHAAAGTYVIHVVGTPSAGLGLIGIQVTDSSNNQVAAFSDALAPPAGSIPGNQGVINDSFTVSTTGNYDVALTDLQFPQALDTVTLAIAQQGGSLVTTIPGGPTTVALQSGVTYRIFAVGQLANGVSSGLYGVNISPTGGGAAVYGQTAPVGAITLLAKQLLTPESYTLSLADLAFPSALSQTAAVITLQGKVVTQLATTGSQAFAATAATYEVYALGVPADPGMGSYSVLLKSAGGTIALSTAHAVSSSASGTFAYSYDTTTAAGQTYALELADFAIPNQLTSVSAAAVQSGAVLGTALTAVGTSNITPAAGPVSLLVFAKAATTGGLFGLDLTATGASSATFETTQGVGQLFDSRQITVTTAGDYKATVADIGFPAQFQNLSVIVTRGTSNVGSIFGGGSFVFPAVAGTYFINFTAQPGSSDGAGTYAINVATAPPAPTLTLTSSAPSVASGGTVTLTWTSGGATSCVASGGWTGNQALSNSVVSPGLTTTTTFTLTCTGDGGPTAKSVTVSVDAPPKSGGGGGGGIRPDILIILAGVLFARALGGRLATRAMRASPVLPTVRL